MASNYPSREDIKRVLATRAVWWKASEQWIIALKQSLGIGGDVGLAFYATGTIRVETSTVNKKACKTALGAACELATKGIFNPFPNGHDVTITMGPQERGPHRDHMFTDATAHTVTTFRWQGDEVEVTITFIEPEVAAAAGGGAFR